jgi:hypothetical protein
MPQNLDIVKKRLNLFRNYLGKFLVPSHLRFPFLAGNQGKCILADTIDKFPLFWFQSGKTITLYCAIKENAIGKNHGAKYAIERLNSSNNKFKVGYLEASTKKFYPQISENLKKELLFEIEKFENSASSHQQGKSHLFSFKLLTPSLRGFGYIETDKALLNPQEIKLSLFADIFKLIFILAFISYCYLLRKKQIFISIRWKLALLFIYANGLPLLVLGTIGYEYLQQSRIALLNDAHKYNQKYIHEFDYSFKNYYKDLSREIAQELTHFREGQTLKPAPKEKYTELARITNKVKADSVYLFDRDGTIRYKYKTTTEGSSQTFLKFLSKAGIQFCNRTTNPDHDGYNNSLDKTQTAKNTFTSNNSALMKNFTKIINIAGLFSFATSQKLCYLTLIGDEKNRNFHSLLIFIWKKRKLPKLLHSAKNKQTLKIQREPYHPRPNPTRQRANRPTKISQQITIKRNGTSFLTANSKRKPTRNS